MTPARDATALNLSVLAAFLFLPNGLHLPYFPVWLSARGLSDAEIAAALATPMILRVAATPLFAAFADRRRIGIALAFAATALFAGYCALGVAVGFAPIFAGAIVVALAFGAMPALADALTLTEIRRAEVAGRPRIAYGHIRVWTSIGVLSTMLASGRIVAAFPGARIFALTALSLFSVAVGVFAAFKMNARSVLAGGGAPGRLTADAVRLRLALVAIGAAAFLRRADGVTPGLRRIASARRGRSASPRRACCLSWRRATSGRTATRSPFCLSAPPARWFVGSP